MVTTHLLARALQGGALLAVVAGSLFVAPVAALADPPQVEITNLQTEVLTGGQLNMQYSIAAPEAEQPGEGEPGGGNPNRATVAYQVTGISCSGDCSGVTQIDAGGDRTFNARLTAPNVNAGETRQVQVRITASINGDSDSATATITVKGPDKPQTVRQVSGKVRDQDGKGVSGATVGLRDSAGATFETTSGSGGAFSFSSTDSRPIAVGALTLGAAKQDFKPITVTVTGSAGGRVSKNIILESNVVETPSASPSASASASASPTPTTEESAAEEQPATTETVEEGAPANNAAASEDSGSSWLYIIIGVLLVAAGIGAIVLVWMRRKNNPSDGDDDPTGMSPPGGAVPPSQGRFNDATRVAAPVGGGRANDATMIAQAPGMADAPTMLQRPVPAVEDEFPDPYGAPVPPQGGYVGAGGWDEPQPGGTQQYGGGTQQYGGGTQQYGGGTQQYGGGTQQYGGGTQQYGGGQPADNGGYGGYSEPTGFYRPEDDAAGYGGYDQGGQQQYGGQQQGGWDEHDNGGYAGYDQGQQQGGWDEHDNGGYPPPQQQGGGQQYGGHTQQYNGGYDQDDYDQRGQRRY
ncbi:Carboxypeptidase regulatory-like domain-containing protein [Paractinoplanes atraurantiacus]|uniref:Carboxypeptidase regulatory-like domain-containing protein n=1 Tax=Paractinoplanes atraurantiacus TaxID=1036182 RepID=A0A285JTF8_9ACTN|nr:Carboxypeptidase regulatory-like domain-containing protein [Actinoplanes atraurantiacus]